MQVLPVIVTVCILRCTQSNVQSIIMMEQQQMVIKQPHSLNGALWAATLTFKFTIQWPSDLRFRYSTAAEFLI